MIEFILSQSHYAPILIFMLLAIAGFNIPISEDLVIISAAILAAVIIPENLTLLILVSYMGALTADIINYWLARYLGPKILQYKLVQKIVSPSKVEKIQYFFNKYGSATIVIGRFIPFGVRNGIYMSAGFSKMNFGKFIIFDGLAASLTTALLFSLGYHFGKNYKILLAHLREAKIYIMIALVFVIVLVSIIMYLRKKRANKTQSI